MNRKNLLFLLVIIIALVTSCKKKETVEEEKAPLIDKQEIKLTSDLMTPEVLWSFGRISEAEVSPDGKTVLFGLTYYSIEQNKGNRELYTIGTDGKDMKRITTSPKGEYNAVWRPDGKRIGFLSPESGSMQIWEVNPDGSDKKQVSETEGDIGGFKYSPDGKRILYTMEIKVDTMAVDIYPDLPKTSGRIITDLMYRHWDTWVETYTHLFYAEYDGKKMGKGTDLLAGQPFETPLKPFGGMEQINWSPDGKSIAYTCKKMKGMQYSLSTNSDIYIYNLDSKETVNISEGMMGFDVAPVYSPDGKMIAWESMERDGYESDQQRLFVYNFETKEKTYVTKNYDQDAHGLAWAADNKTIYFISNIQAIDDIYSTDITTGEVKKITTGKHDYTSVAVAGDKLIGMKMSMAMPSEMFAVDPASGKEQQLTFVNKELLDQITMGESKSRWVTTSDNKQMLVWVIYPPHFDSTKTYPALLYCQGGPQSTVSQFWSYRWNFQMMAANGYIVVAPNRRGVPGFGKAWNEQISGDYGGQNMKDYLAAIDAVAKEPYVDKDHLGAVGASYGGFSVFWLAGNHNKRFKAFIAHDGMFNFESQYLETEEMWFENWDIGGPFWDKGNATAQRSYANSPHKFIDKWDTPILIIHGELDYRIAYTQGMSAFNAAKLRGIPAELLIFPDENHWVLKPQNGILWQRRFYNWLDKYLKQE